MSKEKIDTEDMLPKGWEMKRLEDVIGFQNGFAFQSKLFKNAGKPIVRISNIQNGEIVLDDMIFFDDSDYQKDFEQYKINPGDLVIAMSGATTGKIGINNTGKILYLNQRVGKFEIKNETLKKFLTYFLSTKIEENLKQAFGAAIPNLSTQQINNLALPLPPLPEQQRIVQQLDALFQRIDKAIQLTRENLKHCTHLLPAALNEVFGESEIASMQKLNDIALVARGKSKHRPRNDKKLFGGKYPFIQTGDVRNATKYITEYEQTYSEIGLAQSKLWPKGTICMTIAANIGDVAILGIDACFPDSVVGIQTNKKCNSEYLYYYLQTLQATLDKKSNAAAQKNINLNILEEVEVPIPDLHTQQHIVTYLNQLSSKQQQLQQHYSKQLQQLQALKSSLLDGAFKGEL